MKEKERCSHLKAVTNVIVGDEKVCEECVKQNGTWVHLRTCQECGKTHCCDSSPGKHATEHFKITGHPVVASAEPGERWLWCYEDGQFINY